MCFSKNKSSLRKGKGKQLLAAAVLSTGLAFAPIQAQAAVYVDWVVLTAAIIGLAFTVTTIEGSVTGLSAQVEGELDTSINDAGSIAGLSPLQSDPEGVLIASQNLEGLKLAFLDNQIEGIVFCQNKGGKIAPGVNPITAQVSLLSAQTVKDRNGRLKFSNQHGPDNLQVLVEACPNGNWNVISFTPIAFAAQVQFYDTASQEMLYQEARTCELPNAENLTYEDIASGLRYDCY